MLIFHAEPTVTKAKYIFHFLLKKYFLKQNCFKRKHEILWKNIFFRTLIRGALWNSFLFSLKKLMFLVVPCKIALNKNSINNKNLILWTVLPAETWFTFLSENTLFRFSVQNRWCIVYKSWMCFWAENCKNHLDSIKEQWLWKLSA